MSYKPYSVQLSEGQLKSIARAYKNKDAVTLRLDVNQLKGDNKLMLTQTQINKIRNAIKDKKGIDLKISKSQISKVGGSLFSSLLSLGAKALPYASKIGSKVLPGLATGALSSLGSFATYKLLGSGVQNRPPFGRGIQNIPYYIPYENLHHMRDYTNLSTAKQLKDIRNAARTGRGINMKLTGAQSGGLLGALLGSIGIPLAIEAVQKLTGSGRKRKIVKKKEFQKSVAD